MDIMPTILELAGVPHPGLSFRGRTVTSMRGRSWMPLLSGQNSEVHANDAVTGWELFGCRAVRKGKWKAVLMPTPRGMSLYN